MHPDHDTIATFRRWFLGPIKALFVQVLLMAVETKVLSLDDISLDGTKMHADASKSKAVSYGHLVRLRFALTAEVNELLEFGEAADATARADALDVTAELNRRRETLAHLAQAETMLRARAEE